jgi:hypothetical protein
MAEGNKHRILIDLEKLNRLNAQGCPACRNKFNLGDEVVLAAGKWAGYQYIHKQEAVYEKATNTFYERKYFADKKKKPFQAG